MNNSRILLISYLYSPTVSPRAFRWSAIAEYWAEQGYQVDVVCGRQVGLPGKELLKGVYVHRTGMTSIEFLRKKLGLTDSSRQKYSKAKTPLQGIMFRQTVLHWIKWLHDHSWKKLYWPDSTCLWYIPAKKKATQLLQTYHYAGIISVSHPFISHLVGFQLKKSYPHLPWIMDSGDPFCFYDVIPINNQRFYKKLNYSIERKMFYLANNIAVTIQGTKERYANLFPESATKIHVVPPLLSTGDFQLPKDSMFPSDQKIRLIFVGTLYRSVRNPDFLLRLFEKLLQTSLADRLELHFFGAIHDCQHCFEAYRPLMNTKIFLHGQVSHNKALQAMREATFLVNIGNRTSYQLPSKVVEYASMGKPIVNCVKTEKDSSLLFFEPYPASLSLVEDETKTDSDQFAKLFRFIGHPPHIEVLELQEWLIAFQINAIAEAYGKLLP